MYIKHDFRRIFDPIIEISNFREMKLDEIFDWLIFIFISGNFPTKVNWLWPVGFQNWLTFLWAQYHRTPSQRRSEKHAGVVCFLSAFKRNWRLVCIVPNLIVFFFIVKFFLPEFSKMEISLPWIIINSLMYEKMIRQNLNKIS